jgi:hypothetical protein
VTDEKKPTADATGPLHAKLDSFGVARGCRCAIGQDHDEPLAPEVEHLFGTPRRITVESLRPRPVPEGAAEIQAAINEAVTGARATFVQQSEEQLKDVVRAALKLVEENPRNEPMQAYVSRPAVERMLAADLERTGLGAGERADLAHELFDAGWRPTIDRLVR